MKRSKLIFVAFAALILVASACAKKTSTTGGGGGQAGGLPTKIGPGEGELNLIAWPFYTEPNVVKPFENQSGCKVNVKYGNTSDDMVNLMRKGGGSLYDGVSASGDASNRLIEGGDVQPVNVSLIPDFEQAMEPLKTAGNYFVDDQHFGVPYQWGPNVLMYNTQEVKPTPTSWDVTFESDSPYKGGVTAYDSPIFIADAALYLKTHQPELGITDPYELTTEQLDASVDLLKEQSALVDKYWAVYTDEISGFKNGSMVVGTAWPVNQQYAAAGKNAAPVASVIPEEGVTGWFDVWMMSSNAEHPNCMYMWMAYTMRPEVQAKVAVNFGSTPANAAACAPLTGMIGKKTTDDVYHCGDEEFLSAIELWKTPLADCGDGRTDCEDYTTWTEKWTEIRGA
ncbi:MAG: ABC transporter substrate-binding protein [Actinomycetota bacterium]